MAGAGKRTFIAGEVLTAAQVNDYLMDQAVMRFSGSAARAASITAPTEGMVTYLDDTNRVEVYDGTLWRTILDEGIVTGSAQVLIGTSVGNVSVITASADGQVLTAVASVAGGITWQAVPGAGQAAWANVTTASTNTALTTPLSGGFYKIATSGSTTYTSAQFRFVDTTGNFYGASLSNGTGFFTIPTSVASLNLTTGTPVTVLIEEVAGITNSLQAPPSASLSDFSSLTGASISGTAPVGATLLGFFQTNTGSLVSFPASGGSGSFVSALSASPALGDTVALQIVARDAQGIWTTGVSASARYPFVAYTANASFTMPPWGSGSVDVAVVAGGGGGGGRDATPSGATIRIGGGGGAGGARIVTNVAAPGTTTVTIGSGGAGSAGVQAGSGGTTSFGATTATGGGGGGAANGGPGGTGGSGGGGGNTGPLGSGTGGAGTPGQGNPGATAIAPSGVGGGGGGAGGAGSNTGTGGAGTTLYGVTTGRGGVSGANPEVPTDALGGGGQGRAYGGQVPAATGDPGSSGIVIVKVRQ